MKTNERRKQKEIKEREKNKKSIGLVWIVKSLYDFLLFFSSFGFEKGMYFVIEMYSLKESVA